ncbi:unnamed protein product, partial [Didymodactylos carnosus]
MAEIQRWLARVSIGTGWCLTLFLIRVIGTRLLFYKATLNENLIINVVFKNDDPSEVTPVLRYAPPNMSKSPSRLFPWSLDLADAEDRIHIMEMLDKIQQILIEKYTTKTETRKESLN